LQHFEQPSTIAKAAQTFAATTSTVSVESVCNLLLSSNPQTWNSIVKIFIAAVVVAVVVACMAIKFFYCLKYCFVALLAQIYGGYLFLASFLRIIFAMQRKKILGNKKAVQNSTAQKIYLKAWEAFEKTAAYHLKENAAENLPQKRQNVERERSDSNRHKASFICLVFPIILNPLFLNKYTAH
jgi:hypothetical protein